MKPLKISETKIKTMKKSDKISKNNCVFIGSLSVSSAIEIRKYNGFQSLFNWKE